MPEANEYHPAIKKNMHTEGIDKGRLRPDTELIGKVADYAHAKHDGEQKLTMDVHEFARTTLAMEVAEGTDLTANAAVAGLDGSKSTDEWANKQMQDTINGVRESASQYDELQDLAKAVRDADVVLKDTEVDSRKPE